MPIILAVILIVGALFAGNSIVNPQVESVPTEETPVETPTPSPTPTLYRMLTPTPTLAPLAPAKTKSFSNDPIVDCGTDWQKTHGKTVRAKKSLCDSWVDCQIGDQNIRGPKSTCDDALRKIEEAKKQREGMVNCQTQSGWTHMTKDDCTKAQNAWGNQILDNTKQENQKIIEMFHSFENEIWQATNLDQLDNIRERLRQIQVPEPSIQNYIGTLISIIEERIKILQQR